MTPCKHLVGNPIAAYPTKEATQTTAIFNTETTRMRKLLQSSTTVGRSPTTRSSIYTSSKKNKASKEEIYSENMQIEKHSKVATLSSMQHQ